MLSASQLLLDCLQLLPEMCYEFVLLLDFYLGYEELNSILLDKLLGLLQSFHCVLELPLKSSHPFLNICQHSTLTRVFVGLLFELLQPVLHSLDVLVELALLKYKK